MNQDNMECSNIILCPIVLTVILPICGCNQSNANQAANEADTVSVSVTDDSYKLDFSEYGFVLNAPCEMKDVSAQASGDFLLNYGGVTDGNDPSRMTAYQLIVTLLPVGYKDIPKDELASKIDILIKSRMSSMKNVKPINFGYEGYKGYVGESTHNGMGQKGVIFSKENYIIALTVITNNDLNAKFNKFTNGFKAVSITTKTTKKVSATKKTAQRLAFGYSVEAPCGLKQYSSQDVDYSYSGAINPDNQDIAVVYKIQASQLPMALSNMQSSDKNQIKSNLINYLKSKGRYSICQVNVKNVFAYKTDYEESGFQFKECMILTDNHVIELMVFSKQGVSNKQFMEFVNSLNRL